MIPFTCVVGPAVPLLRSNIDTDVIIRIERLTTLSKEQLGPYAFEALRYTDEGAEEPDFVLNKPAFSGAPILLAGSNFGCGSSREGAVWALQALGIRCVIAPSYGDIFYANCFQNGVLAITLPLNEVEKLADLCSDASSVSVSLEACSLTYPNGEVRSFEVDAIRRQALLAGLDDIGLTLKDDETIRAWQHKDRIRRPWAWPTPNTTDSA